MITLNKMKNETASEQSPTTKEEMIETASKYKNMELLDSDDETTYWFIIVYILLMYIDY